MAVDRTKVLEAAQKHLGKGAYDKAIAELQKLVKADPSDVRTWLKIGDLYVKLNQRPQAIETYARVADQYAAQGFFHKAVAVYRQILNLDSTRLDARLKLAEMHEAMQLTSEALQAYEQVAAEYGRLGETDKALAAFGRMVQLDPQNIPTRIKYAEALSRAGRSEEAAAAFEVGADLLKQQGRIDDYIKVVERLLFHREDVARARELAEMYLERNDGKRALAKLQILFKADPRDISTLELLARAFEQVQQLPKTISVLREIARLHGEQGRVEERARALKRILALDPGDPEARQALAQLAAASRPGPGPVRRDLEPPPGALVEPSRARRALSEPSEEVEPELEAVDDGIEGADEDVVHLSDDDEPSDEEIDDRTVLGTAFSEERPHVEQPDEEPASTDEASDVFIVEDDPVEESALPETEFGSSQGAGAAMEPRPSLPPDVARAAHIAKLLTEVDVFMRYGLKQKVVEQLRQVLALDPAHVEARERLKDIFVERGDFAAAASELVALADVFARDKPAVALLYLRQARELDPTSADVLARLEVLEARPSLAPAARSGRPAEGVQAAVPDAVATPTLPSEVSEDQSAAEPPRPSSKAPLVREVDRRSLPEGGSREPRGPLAAASKPSAGGPAPNPGPAVGLRPRPLLAGLKARPLAFGRAAMAAPPVRSPLRESPPAPTPPGSSEQSPTQDASATREDAGPNAPPTEASIAPAPTERRSPEFAPEPLEVPRVEQGPQAATDAPSDLSARRESDARSAPPSAIAPAATPAADLLAPLSPEEFERAPLQPSVPDEPTTGRASLPPGEVEEILDEAEFFVAQGLFAEGIDVLRDALATHPTNRLLLDKIAELEEQAARTSFALREASRPPPSVDQSFELASKLADEVETTGSREGSDMLDVEAVFAQFKKGVEAQVAPDDADTHYDLGIAYKEMGLLADAIHEFELCTSNPNRECMAYTMIGLCQREKGDLVAAVSAFKKGLYAERRTEREELGLYFELGRAYEAMHDAREALYYYEKVKKRDPNFLDVQARIDALTTGRKEPTTNAPSEGNEFDAAFDDVMGKE